MSQANKISRGDLGANLDSFMVRLGAEGSMEAGSDMFSVVSLALEKCSAL